MLNLRSTGVLLLAPLLLVGCFRNPITSKRQTKLISETAERQIGAQTKINILKEYGELKDPVLVQYVANLGQKLAAVCDRPKVDYEFLILDTDLVNAFAAPGGIYFCHPGSSSRNVQRSRAGFGVGPRNRPRGRVAFHRHDPTSDGIRNHCHAGRDCVGHSVGSGSDDYGGSIGGFVHEPLPAGVQPGKRAGGRSGGFAIHVVGGLRSQSGLNLF
jgi:hypothetical protein